VVWGDPLSGPNVLGLAPQVIRASISC